MSIRGRTRTEGPLGGERNATEYTRGDNPLSRVKRLGWKAVAIGIAPVAALVVAGCSSSAEGGASHGSGDTDISVLSGADCADVFKSGNGKMVEIAGTSVDQAVDSVDSQVGLNQNQRTKLRESINTLDGEYRPDYKPSAMGDYAEFSAVVTSDGACAIYGHGSDSWDAQREAQADYLDGAVPDRLKPVNNAQAAN